jgi:hypothetical protein
MDDVTWGRHRACGGVRSEAGEGVISAAIAVLVMAVIGAAMYAAFSITFDSAQGTIDQKVAEIR